MLFTFAIALSATILKLIFPEPSKLAEPLKSRFPAEIDLAVANLVAVAAFPVMFPEEVIYPCALTKAVVAIFVELSAVAGVGASVKTFPEAS